VKNRLLSAGALWLGAVAGVFPQTAGPGVSNTAVRSVSAHRDVIATYCASCHNERLKTAGLALDRLNLDDVAGSAETWEKVVRKVRGGLMPPAGARQPDARTRDAFATSIETELDRAWAAHPNPGRPLLRRLNRAEYANAVRDLLALDVDVAALLPPDDSAYGFDNISDALNVSPALQERYLAAAEKIGELAIGDADAGTLSDTYHVRGDVSQNQHLDGMPLGTLGGTRFTHFFPRDGEYVIRTALFRTNFDNPRGIEYPSEFELTVDGERVHHATIGGAGDLSAAFEQPKDAADAIDERLAVRVRVRAGPHDVVAAFIGGAPTMDATKLRPFLKSAFDTLDWTGHPHVRSVTITGPFNATGPGETPSRRRIFTCRPTPPANEDTCAKQIVSTLARRAFREPVDEKALQPLLAFYKSGRKEGSFDLGIERALQLILASPKFVFRVERSPDPAGPPLDMARGALSHSRRANDRTRPTVARVTDVELASRLSFFLWSSIPDDELMAEATAGRLKDPSVLQRQTRRMLADPRAQALVSNFAGQWLHLRNLRNAQPHADDFPDFDDNLRHAFQRETELLFESVMREDRSVVDLLRADYTFVNERLARHYGIPNVYGSQFRRVPVTDEARKGLLGHGSILTLTSHATRTSPVVRGKFILENILGTPPPGPPPDVPALKENEKGQKPKTMREQLAEHRANPTCASCHKIMDPIGFALENFDAVGAWRTEDAGVAIDASGELSDGTKIDGVVALRKSILARPDLFAGTMTEKLLVYALGRGLDAHDMPVVRGILRTAAAQDYRFSSLILGVVDSVPFQMRMKMEAQ
jgi:mono/diheme cytochrome c family protein